MVESARSGQVEEQIQAMAKLRRWLSMESSSFIDRVIKTGVVNRFVELLRSPHALLRFETAWALTNVVSGSTLQTEAVINAGAVPVLVELLSSPEPDVCEQVLWALGNIAGDSPRCRDCVLNAGALRPLLNLMSDGCGLSMLRVATWTLSNLCYGNSLQSDWNSVFPHLSDVFLSLI